MRVNLCCTVIILLAVYSITTLDAASRIKKLDKNKSDDGPMSTSPVPPKTKTKSFTEKLFGRKRRESTLADHGKVITAVDDGSPTRDRCTIPPIPDTAGILNVYGMAKRMPEEIYAFGDIHGDLDALHAVLTHSGIARDDPNDANRVIWNAKENVLVITGDLVDRGPDSTGVLRMVFDLRRQARSAGGDVVLLKGNHEVIMLTNTLESLEMYTSDIELLRLSNPEQLSMLDDNGVDVEMLIQNLYSDPKIWVPRGLAGQFPGQKYQAWRKRMTQLLQERVYAEFGPELESLFVAAQFGPFVFSHGGIPPHLAPLGVAKINDLAFQEWPLLVYRQGRNRPEDGVPYVFGDDSDASAAQRSGVIWTKEVNFDSRWERAKQSCENNDRALQSMQDAFVQIVGHVPGIGEIIDFCGNKRLFPMDNAMSRWVASHPIWRHNIAWVKIRPRSNVIELNHMNGYNVISVSMLAPADITSREYEHPPPWHSEYFARDANLDSFARYPLYGPLFESKDESKSASSSASPRTPKKGHSPSTVLSSGPVFAEGTSSSSSSSPSRFTDLPSASSLIGTPLRSSSSSESKAPPVKSASTQKGTMGPIPPRPPRKPKQPSSSTTTTPSTSLGVFADRPMSTDPTASTQLTSIPSMSSPSHTPFSSSTTFPSSPRRSLDHSTPTPSSDPAAADPDQPLLHSVATPVLPSLPSPSRTGGKPALTRMKGRQNFSKMLASEQQDQT